jgi:hypothetical protein
MNWLDKVIEKHGDVIFILIAVGCAACYIWVNWYAIHHGG